VLFALPSLDGADRRALDEIDELHDRCSRPTGEAPWSTGVRRRFFAGAVLGSTAVDGYGVLRSAVEAVAAGLTYPASEPY
jgi:hypothetical protein